MLEHEEAEELVEEEDDDSKVNVDEKVFLCFMEGLDASTRRCIVANAVCCKCCCGSKGVGRTEAHLR